jgi:hypothetical protein
VLRRAGEKFTRLSHLWLDAEYKGEDKGKGWAQKALGGVCSSWNVLANPPPGGVDELGCGVG